MSKKKKKGTKKNISSNKVKTNKEKNSLNIDLISIKESIKHKRKTKRKFIVVIVLETILIVILLLALLNMNNQHSKVEPESEPEIDNSVYLFLGDSITNQYDVDKYYPELNVVNSGINGHTTDDILGDLKNRVFQHNPTDVILLIGINQVHSDEVEHIVDDTIDIITKIKEHDENIEIYVESIYPVNTVMEGSLAKGKDNNKVKIINEKMKQYCEENNIAYIDVYNDLLDENGNLKEEYTEDGLHVNSEAYKIITSKIKEVINTK